MLRALSVITRRMMAIARAWEIDAAEADGRRTFGEPTDAELVEAIPLMLGLGMIVLHELVERAEAAGEAGDLPSWLTEQGQ